MFIEEAGRQGYNGLLASFFLLVGWFAGRGFGSTSIGVYGEALVSADMRLRWRGLWKMKGNFYG